MCSGILASPGSLALKGGLPTLPGSRRLHQQPAGLGEGKTCPAAGSLPLAQRTCLLSHCSCSPRHCPVRTWPDEAALLNPAHRPSRCPHREQLTWKGPWLLMGFPSRGNRNAACYIDTQYADDSVILFRTKRGLQHQHEALEAYCRRNDLPVNKDPLERQAVQKLHAYSGTAKSIGDRVQETRDASLQNAAYVICIKDFVNETDVVIHAGTRRMLFQLE